MIELPSKLENQQFKLIDLENQLKPLGYEIGANWDYDHGSFDYKVDVDKAAYVYLRLPFNAVEGELDQKGTVVEIGRPFLLKHDYKEELDDQVMNYNSFMNQFSEPENKDAAVPNPYITTGEKLVQELEATLLR